MERDTKKLGRRWREIIPSNGEEDGERYQDARREIPRN
jgi:hypothetical protein